MTLTGRRYNRGFRNMYRSAYANASAVTSTFQKPSPVSTVFNNKKEAMKLKEDYALKGIKATIKVVSFIRGWRTAWIVKAPGGCVASPAARK